MPDAGRLHWNRSCITFDVSQYNWIAPYSEHVETVMMWFWLIPLVILVLAIPFLMRTYGQEDRQRAGAGRPAPSATEILEERYARGEIDREEFEQKKRDLQR